MTTRSRLRGWGRIFIPSVASILVAGTGNAQTCALVGPCGDTDHSGTLTSVDALRTLRGAVGLPIEFVCECSTAHESADVLLFKTGQTESRGEGDDGDIQAGVERSYTDNGDGTITDLRTGLMWEKKRGLTGNPMVACDSPIVANCGDPHNADNAYSWTKTGTAFDGRVVTLFLHQLNHRCDRDLAVLCEKDADCFQSGGECGFAGYRDWRLPNVKELQSIQTYLQRDSGTSPFHTAGCPGCTDISNPNCSCDTGTMYLSSTSTYATWGVSLFNGETGQIGGLGFYAARAVRVATP